MILGLSFFVQCWWLRESMLWGFENILYKYKMRWLDKACQFQFFFAIQTAKLRILFSKHTYKYLANGKNPIPSYRPSGNFSTTSGMFWPLKVFEQCVSLHSFHTFWRNNKTPKTEEYSKYTSCLTFKWMRRGMCFAF